MAAQSYCVVKARNDRRHAYDVADLKQQRARLRIEGKFQRLAGLIREAVDRNFAAVGNRTQVTRHFQQVIQR